MSFLLNSKRKKTIKMLCDKAEKYTREKGLWRTCSPLDIKNIDLEIMDALKFDPGIATMTSSDDKIPFILFCVKCGMHNAVMYYIDKFPNAYQICDENGDNIAFYALNFKLDRIIQACRTRENFAHSKNKMGVSFEQLYNIEQAKKEVKSEAIEDGRI